VALVVPLLFHPRDTIMEQAHQAVRRICSGDLTRTEVAEVLHLAGQAPRDLVRSLFQGPGPVAHFCTAAFDTTTVLLLYHLAVEMPSRLALDAETRALNMFREDEGVRRGVLQLAANFQMHDPWDLGVYEAQERGQVRRDGRRRPKAEVYLVAGALFRGRRRELNIDAAGIMQRLGRRDGVMVAMRILGLTLNPLP
jgi:hypothetical protein